MPTAIQFSSLPAWVGGDKHAQVASERVAHGALDTDIRGHAADNQCLDPATVETNFVPIPGEHGLIERLLERGVAVSDLRPGWLRAVTHLDIRDEEIDVAIDRMQEVLSVHA